MKRAGGARWYPPTLRTPLESASSTQYWSDETVSPPARVRIERKATRLMLSLMNRTEPSPKRALMPPGWNEYGSSFGPAWLPAVAIVVGQGTPSLVGSPLLLGWPDVPNAEPGSAHLQ